MDINRIEQIKKLALIAIFSDNKLFEILALKGGSAIDMFYPPAGRASIDLDCSLSEDLGDDEKSLCKLFSKLLMDTFSPVNYIVFDVKFEEKPENLSAEMATFWGGYLLEFKVIEKHLFDLHGSDLQKIRNYAKEVGPRHRKTFQVDFSKFEYCNGKVAKILDDYTIYVYTPLMIACEKLRAICQQTSDYREIVKSHHPASRARDFFDIHYLTEREKLDWQNDETLAMVRAMFKIKRVPWNLLGKIHKYRRLHEKSFAALRDTVRPNVKLLDFDFYFDFVLDIAGKLEPLGDE